MPCAAVLELDRKAAARVDRLSRRLERELGIATALPPKPAQQRGWTNPFQGR